MCDAEALQDAMSGLVGAKENLPFTLGAVGLNS